MTSETIRLSDQRIDDSIRALLDTYPDAAVAALSESWQFCAIPEGVPVAGHPVLHARDALELVAAGSHQTMLDMFVRAREDGACQARLTTIDGLAATGYVLDVRRCWGVYLLIWVMAGRDQPASPVDLPTPKTVAPRYGRMWRNRHADTIRVDPGMCRMLGYSEAELASIAPLELLHPDDQRDALDEWLDIVGAAPGSVRRARARRRRADGSWVWLEVTNTNHLDDPDQPHVLSEMIDVSEEIAVREQLRHHQGLLQRIAATVPLGLWVLRSPGNPTND